MAEGRYLRIRDARSGVTFVFAYDPDAPDLLHIYARHVTTPADAIRTFRQRSSDNTTWNAGRRRFETISPTHGLLWYWLREP